MNRNKEYRLKRKSQRKDYIIQDKNLTIKTLYYRNETKRNKIEQLEQENKQLKEENERYRKLGFKHLNEQNNQLKEVIEEVREYMEKHILATETEEVLLQILDKARENK